MSSQPKGTAVCAVTWEVDRAVTVTPCLGCDDEMLSEMIAKSDAVGIDAPFGWPAEFAVAVGPWSFTSWDHRAARTALFPGDRSSCARNRGTLAAERVFEKFYLGASRLSMRRMAARSMKASEVWTFNS